MNVCFYKGQYEGVNQSREEVMDLLVIALMKTSLEAANLIRSKIYLCTCTREASLIGSTINDGEMRQRII